MYSSFLVMDCRDFPLVRKFSLRFEFHSPLFSNILIIFSNFSLCLSQSVGLCTLNLYYPEEVFYKLLAIYISIKFGNRFPIPIGLFPHDRQGFLASCPSGICQRAHTRNGKKRFQGLETLNFGVGSEKYFNQLFWTKSLKDYLISKVKA